MNEAKLAMVSGRLAKLALKAYPGRGAVELDEGVAHIVAGGAVTRRGTE